MHVKKNLMLWVAVLALALPLFLTGTASAIYVGDGTVQNGTTGGWDITDYGKCVTGVKSDGTMIIDNTITSRPDCLVKTFPAYTTQAACLLSDKAGADVEGSHYWASTCIADDGTAISLKDLDRTQGMCNAAAIKAGKTSGTMTNACTSAWVYTGPAGDGAPGFCYTTVNLSTAFTTTASCPTSTVGYSWANPKCTFSYGVAGYANAAIAKKDGSGNYAAAGAFVDLSTLTQGQCIAAGASWSTGVTKSGTTSVATTPNASTVAVATGSRAGCLECHNSTSQNNGYAGRWKDTYRTTGHKNMLRKVTAGMNWAGPDENGILSVYTSAATGSIDFTTATAKISGVDKPLLYLFGDWMAPAPGGLDVIVNMSGFAKYNGTSNYSCAPCHSTGWSNNDGVAGVCSQSSKTTSAACTGAGGTWYPMTGVQGASYTPAEPAASFPSITFTGAGKWDRDGILCSRCHQSVFAQTGTNANGSAFAGPAGTSTHNVTPATTANQQVNNICFGCHQSIAKANNGLSADNTDDPTVIPVKNAATAPAYVPEFNGHVLGNSFLNSPHARFTGTIVPNGLGKYDLVGNAANQYSSAFKGFVCRSSVSAGGGSILETVIKNGVIEEIKTQADCISANTTSTTAGVAGMWQQENQGACTTCHNVHKSMFVANSESLKVECQTCHADTTGTSGTGYKAAGVPQVNATAMNHPTGTNTPFDTTKFANACEICHMPKATDGGFPMHLWRINTAATYSTFPTTAEFGTSGTGTTLKNARTAPDGTYTKAVWVDVDLACGQCHGGSAGSGATKYSAPYFDKMYLSQAATNMHLNNPTASFGWQVDPTGDYKVTLNGSSSTCPGSDTCTYSWSTGETGITASHTFPDSTPVAVTLTVSDTTTGGDSSITKTVTPQYMAATPTALTGVSVTPTGLSATANWTLAGGVAPYMVRVNWGDGTTDPVTQPLAGAGTLSHNYAAARTYTVSVYAIDSGVNGSNQTSATVTTSVTTVASSVTVSGLVSRLSGTPVSGASVSLKLNGVTKKLAYTDASGNYSIAGVASGTYTIVVAKSGVTFTNPAATITVAASPVVQNITATN